MRCTVLLLCLLLAALAFSSCVSASTPTASAKVSQLKTRVVSAVKAALKPGCAKGPTTALPVLELGVADQLPGDRQANEVLIAQADGAIEQNKAKTIKQRVLDDSEKAVNAALNVQDDFHQFQAKVLREPLLPK